MCSPPLYSGAVKMPRVWQKAITASGCACSCEAKVLTEISAGVGAESIPFKSSVVDAVAGVAVAVVMWRSSRLLSPFYVMAKQGGAYLPATTTSRLKWKCPECNKQTGQSINQFQVMTILASNNSQVLAFSTATAKLLGDMAAATILQQIHYWTEKENCGRIFDGVRWIYKSYKQWQEDFSWMSIHQIRRCIGILRSFGVVKVEQWTKHNDDKNCYWYTVDYETLDALLAEESTSRPYRTTCAQKRTTPAESDTSPVESGTLSIYKEYKSRIHTQENNNPKPDADFCVEEESHPNEIEDKEKQDYSSVANKTESMNAGKELVNPENKKASAARYNNNIALLRVYGFELTKQLEKLAAKYSEKEIERSLEYLEECKSNGQSIQKEAGWLTECLKDGWWMESFKSQEEQAVINGLHKEGKSLKNPEQFFCTLWKMFDQGYINAMPENFIIEGQLSSTIQFKDDTFYVNWHDQNFQKKQELGIFQTMALQEAVSRFNTDQV